MHKHATMVNISHPDEQLMACPRMISFRKQTQTLRNCGRKYKQLRAKRARNFRDTPIELKFKGHSWRSVLLL